MVGPNNRPALYKVVIGTNPSEFYTLTKADFLEYRPSSSDISDPDSATRNVEVLDSEI